LNHFSLFISEYGGKNIKISEKFFSFFSNPRNCLLQRKADIKTRKEKEGAMLVTKQDLEQAHQSYKKWGWKKREEYFPVLFLSREFKKPPEDLQAFVSTSISELGVNAFYLDRDRKNFYLYSFHWTDNHKSFKDSFVKLIQTGLESICSDTSSKDPFLGGMKAALYENQSIIDRVFVYFVFNGDPEKAQNSATLSSLREDLESKKYLIDRYFQNKEVTLNVDFLSNESKRRGGFASHRKTYTYTLPFPHSIERKNSDSNTLYMGFIKIFDLVQMYEEMGLRLFEKNIRAGLSPDNSPNRSIRKSLKNILAGTEDPANFSFHHNGITISAEHVKLESGSMEITEPRILNGAQTVTSLARFIEENSGTKVENNKNLRSVEILAKVIHPNPAIDSSGFIVNVTINNNRQNPVEPWNLRASDLIQLEFSDKFKDELSVYYERQEKAFDSLTQEDLEEMGIGQNKSISIKKLGQTFLAIQGEIDKISRLRDVFEDEKKYYNTFKKRYLSVDARNILLLYKTQFRLGSVTNTIQENTAEKYYELFSKSKNLIWSLVLQAILNDPKFGFWVENYGRNLLIEANFNELLKTLGDKKVRPILHEIWRDEKFQKNIQEQNYLFLRNKTTFEKAMEIAKQKYGWSKLDL
jgi:hypothetical protein